jgi:hypothetical protein
MRGDRAKACPLQCFLAFFQPPLVCTHEKNGHAPESVGSSAARQDYRTSLDTKQLFTLSTDYSSRNAVIGSIRDAFRAGT